MPGAGNPASADLQAPRRRRHPALGAEDRRAKGPVLTDMFPRDEFFFLNHTHLDSWRPRDLPR
jgi:hypothetical protein